MLCKKGILKNCVIFTVKDLIFCEYCKILTKTYFVSFCIFIFSLVPSATFSYKRKAKKSLFLKNCSGDEIGLLYFIFKPFYRVSKLGLYMFSFKSIPSENCKNFYQNQQKIYFVHFRCGQCSAWSITIGGLTIKLSLP